MNIGILILLVLAMLFNAFGAFVFFKTDKPWQALFQASGVVGWIVIIADFCSR